MRTRLIGLAAVVAALGAPAAASAQRPEPPPPVHVRILGVNDLHGNLEPTTPGTISATGNAADRVPAGGVEYLATHLRQLQAEGRPYTTTVGVGDDIGGSPLLSSLFHDEPTIEALNRMDVDFSAVGNHEFDEGAAELRRMQRGGCHPVDGCQDGTPFEGAAFQYLAANVIDVARDRPLFKPYVIRRYGGVRVGFIGEVLQGTPDIVIPSGVRGLEFEDEADTANRYARELLDRGVQAIVLLLHQGGSTGAPGGVDDCNGGLQGAEINDILARLDREIDVVMSAHSHTGYICRVGGRLVTQGASYGRLITDVDLTLSHRTHDVLDATAVNHVVTQDVPKADDMTALLAHYDAIAAPLRDRPIGRIAADITRTPDDSGETAAGDLIADAQLAATDDPGTGDAVAAFMNPGGVRNDFLFAQSGTEGDGVLTYGESFAVQPFGNSLVTLTLTGAQLRRLLDQQWCGQSAPRILAPSATVSYAYSRSIAASIVGTPCPAAQSPVSDLRIAGAPVEDAASYRITVNSFLAEGGDLFTVLREGKDRLGGPVDADALADYIAPSLTGDPVVALPLDRVDVVP